MSGNTFGKLFKITTFGESHGMALGCIIDGMPSNFAIDLENIQKELDRRRPGQSKFVSQRKELDEIQVLSGILEGKSLGTPITIVVPNVDAKSKDYSNIKDKFRPGHGDFTYHHKYKIRDYRGGGRASARETVARVIAGAIAKQYLLEKYNIEFTGYLSQIGEISIKDFCIDSASNNQFNFADKNHDNIASIERYINLIRKNQDSIGAKLSVIIKNAPIGLGEPVFDKLDALLAYAFMGIPAVKAVEIGKGVDCVTSFGSEFRDLITIDGFSSNNAGGVLAGLSTGQDIIAHLSFKPASSIAKPCKTIDKDNNLVDIRVLGRHDPCVAIRAVPIVEAMSALVMMDLILQQNAKGETNASF